MQVPIAVGTLQRAEYALQSLGKLKSASMLSTSLQVMSLRRPGLAAVQKIMGWTPLHLAAAEGEVQLMESLIQEHGCDILARSVNSWTPLHYAAAHNKVLARTGPAHRGYQCSAMSLWSIGNP